MKRKSFGGWMLMGLILGCATAPQPQPSTPTAQSTQKDEKATAAGAKQDPDRTLVCESVAVTGSHLPRKICRTQRQVDQERERAQKAVQDANKINRDWNK